MHSHYRQPPFVYWVRPETDEPIPEEPAHPSPPHMFAQFRSVRFDCATVAFVDPHIRSEQVMKGSFNAISRLCTSSGVDNDVFEKEKVVRPQRHPRRPSRGNQGNGDLEDSAYRPNIGSHYTRRPTKVREKSTKKPCDMPEGWFCASCGVTTTVQARRSSLGPATLCNRCGLLWAKERLPGIDRRARMQRSEPICAPSPESTDTAWTENVWNLNDPPSPPRADERMGIAFITL
jgi:hypothetical protein